MLYALNTEFLILTIFLVDLTLQKTREAAWGRASIQREVVSTLDGLLSFHHKVNVVVFLESFFSHVLVQNCLQTFTEVPWTGGKKDEDKVGRSGKSVVENHWIKGIIVLCQSLDVCLLSPSHSACSLSVPVSLSVSLLS